MTVPMRLLLAILVLVLIPFFVWENEIAGLASHWLAKDVPRVNVCTAVVALLALDIVLPVPSSVVSVAAGALLGFQMGFLANWAGMMTGCCIGYVLGRAAQPWALGRLVRDREWKLIQGRLNEYAVLAVLLSRPVPVIAEMVVLSAGVLKLPWARVLGIAALGNAAIAAIYAGAGAFGLSRERFLAAFAISVILPWLGVRCFSLWLKRPAQQSRGRCEKNDR